MKRIFWVSATVLTIFALSLSAFAQPGGQGGQRGAGQGGQGGQGQGQGQRAAQGGQFGGGAQPGAQFGGAQMTQMGGQATTPQGLLGNAEVRTRLALTEAQITSLTALFPARAGGAAPGAVPGGPPAGGPPQTGVAGRAPGGAPLTAAEQAERDAAARTQTTERWAGINRILNAEQQAKFKEIYFQANNGLNNVTTLDDWMLAVLDLNPAQKEAIVKIVDARTAANRAAMPAGGGQQAGGQTLTAEERQARTAETTARNTRFADQIKAVLTAAQTTKATQLTTGAVALREAIGIRAPGAGGPGQGGPGQGGPGQGAPGGAAPGGPGQRGGQGGGAGGAGGGGFTPGGGTGGNFQPGAGGQRQGAGAGAGGAAGGQRGQGGAGGAGGGNRGGGAGGGN